MSTTTVKPPSGVRSTGTLFNPLQLGPYSLRHRILMAPLTRSRARQPGNVPTSLMACYYSQRASAALIISEATQVSMQGQGYGWTPGIHSGDQVEGWRLVTNAVRLRRIGRESRAPSARSCGSGDSNLGRGARRSALVSTWNVQRYRRRGSHVYVWACSRNAVRIRAGVPA